jgi:hypothetical protein
MIFSVFYSHWLVPLFATKQKCPHPEGPQLKKIHHDRYTSSDDCVSVYNHRHVCTNACVMITRSKTAPRTSSGSAKWLEQSKNRGKVKSEGVLPPNTSTNLKHQTYRLYTYRRVCLRGMGGIRSILHPSIYGLVPIFSPFALA